MARLAEIPRSIDLVALHAVLFEGEAQSEGWLADCIIDQAPTTQTLIIASESRFAVLQPSPATALYEVIGRGSEIELPFDGKQPAGGARFERINSVRCVEYPKGKDRGMGTAVVVGYNTGYVRIFTEGGRMLVSQILHEGPVTRLRGQPAKGCEDLAVLYSRTLVVMDGFGLLQTIRACVSRLSRGFDLDVDDCPPLSLKKWGLAAQKQSDDVVCFGASVPSAYENLLVQRSSSSPVHKYVVCGARPMMMAYSTAGCEQSYFSAKALASNVAAKLGTAMLSVVSSFWGGADEPNVKGKGAGGAAAAAAGTSTAAKERATALNYEYELDDPRRHMYSMEVAPNDGAILTTDSFGRVILFDALTGTMVWIWKGYRDAQCGWLVATEGEQDSPAHGEAGGAAVGAGRVSPYAGEEEEETPPRACPLVVIYAPKRGLLEIWAPWFGHRVAAFNVGLNCQLLVQTPPRTISATGGLRKGGKCSLILPDGSIRQVVVSFDAALSHATSAGLRDIQRIRKLRSVLNPFRSEANGEGSPDEELVAELKEVVGQMQSPAGLQRCLDLVREVRLPDKLGTLVVKELRTAFDVLSRTQGGEKGEAKSLSDDAIRFQSELVIREKQLAAHEALTRMATDRLKLLARPEDAAGRSIDLEPVKMAKDAGSSDVNRLLRVWTRAFPDAAASAAPVSVPVESFLWIVDQEAVGEEQHKVADEEQAQLSKFCFQSIVSGSCVPDQLLPELRATSRGRDQLLAAFVMWGCTIPLWCLMLDTVHGMAMTVLEALIKDPRPPRQQVTRQQHLEPWEDAFRYACAEMDAPAHALVLCCMGRSLGKDDEKWTAALTRHVDALYLCLILSASQTRVPPVADLHSSARLAPLVTSHFLAVRCTADDVVAASAMVEKRAVEALLDLEDRSTPTQLSLLSVQLPLTCSPTSVALRCASRHLEAWIQAPEIVSPLQLAVDLIGHCGDHGLGQAVALSVWKDHFKASYGVLYDLIEKIGKAPKPRLCAKHLGWDEHTTVAFAAATVGILNILCQNVIKDGGPRRPREVVEERWALGPETNTIFGELTMAELQCGDLNQRVIKQHLLLAQIMYAIVHLRLRATRPSTLFTSHTRALLFSPFSGEHAVGPEDDLLDDAAGDDADAGRVYEDPAEAAAAAAAAEARSARRHFMFKVINEVVRQECVDDGAGGGAGGAGLGLDNVFSLSESLGLGKDDSVRRHYVAVLLEYGRDAEAHDYLPSVVESEKMAAQLLEVAVRQLSALLDPDLSPDAMTLTGQLPPAVYDWCQAARFVPAGSRAIGAADTPRVTSPGRVVELLERVLTLAPQDSSDRTRAERLSAALQKVAK